MRGSAFLRGAVRDHLETRLNPAVAMVATDLGADVPPVEEFHSAWQSLGRIARWPAVMVTARTGTGRGRVDFDAGQPVHTWEWTMRVWVWARGDGYAETSDRVEVLATAVVEVLTARPGLGDPGDRCRVVTEGDLPFRVSLSDIAEDDEERLSIAGAYVEFVATMAETARIPAVGTAQDLAVEVEPKEP